MQKIVLFIFVFVFCGCIFSKGYKKSIHGRYYCENEIGEIYFDNDGTVVNLPEYAGLAIHGNEEIYRYYSVQGGWVLEDNICSENKNFFWYTIDTTYRNMEYPIAIGLTTCDNLGYNWTFRNLKISFLDLNFVENSKNFEPYLATEIYKRPYNWLYFNLSEYNDFYGYDCKYLKSFSIDYYSEKTNKFIKYQIDFTPIDSGKIIINIPRDEQLKYFIQKSSNDKDIILINNETQNKCNCKYIDKRKGK